MFRFRGYLVASCCKSEFLSFLIGQKFLEMEMLVIYAIDWHVFVATVGSVRYKAISNHNRCSVATQSILNSVRSEMLFAFLVNVDVYRNKYHWYFHNRKLLDIVIFVQCTNITYEYCLLTDHACMHCRHKPQVHTTVETVIKRSLFWHWKVRKSQGCMVCTGPTSTCTI